MRPFRFGLSAYHPMAAPTASAWRDLARRAEDLGFSTLLAADHLGAAGALAPLAIAAAATERLRVGTLVLNHDFFHPLRLAQEAATIDQLTGGRLELGLGSGWNRPEYDLLGVPYEPAPVRAARLADGLRTMKQAWAGEVGLGAGEEPRRAVPAPAQAPHPPILIGGHGDAILSLAATEADIVGFTGIAWRKGELVPTGMTARAIGERVDFVLAAAGDRAASLELSSLVQRVHTGPADEVLEELAALGLPPEEVEDSPFFLIGSPGELIEKLLALREHLGLSYWVIFEPALEAMIPIVAALAGR